MKFSTRRQFLCAQQVLAFLLLLASLGYFLRRLAPLLVAVDGVTTTTTTAAAADNKESSSSTTKKPATKTDLRVLYIVTSLSEFDTGKRSTTAGDDRFAHTVLPVISETAYSLAQQFTHVDVYLIAHYDWFYKNNSTNTNNTTTADGESSSSASSSTRWHTLQQALPSTVGLHHWMDATPLGYASEDAVSINGEALPMSQRRLSAITRALARQHRYVIKDLLEQYDLFINFEDDMLIHGTQAQAYVDVTQQLYQLRSVAPVSLPKSPSTIDPLKRFHGPLTKVMLSRMLPGWIRVEHLPDGPSIPVNKMNTKQSTHRRFEQIPVNMEWPIHDKPTTTTTTTSTNTAIVSWLRRRVLPTAITTQTRTVSLDPAPCCRVRQITPHIPNTLPPIHELYFWETSIQALGLREIPGPLGWALLQTGNDDQYMSDLNNFAIGDYWTGRDGYFDTTTGVITDTPARPERSAGDFMNNQGGWMATKRQILEWNRLWCRGSFLPPFDKPVYAEDGLSKITVEFWSGGFQIAGMRACNLQRLIPLDPALFAHFLLYHTSNNKQRQKYVRHRFYGRHVQDFWGQLNTVRLNAERQKAKELARGL